MTYRLEYDEIEKGPLTVALLAASIQWNDGRIPLELLERVDPAVADAARAHCLVLRNRAL